MNFTNYCMVEIQHKLYISALPVFDSFNIPESSITTAKAPYAWYSGATKNYDTGMYM